MTYCPEHGGEMVCRNPNDYDGLVYECPEGHIMVYSDGTYRDSTHPDFGDELPESCPSCGADTYTHEPVAPTWPWHLVDDDCRAIRTPLEVDSSRYCGCGHADMCHCDTNEDGYQPCVKCECGDFRSSPDYCGCGHADLRHVVREDGYNSCVICECADFSLPEDDGLFTQRGHCPYCGRSQTWDGARCESDACPSNNRGMQSFMQQNGTNQLIAKEYAQAHGMEDELTKGGKDSIQPDSLEGSTHHTQAVAAESPPSPVEPQGMEDFMVVHGSQLIAKEYAATMEPARTLTQDEIDELVDLGRRIVLSLECDINDNGLPCYEDRQAAVTLMQSYLELHDYVVVTLEDAKRAQRHNR